MKKFFDYKTGVFCGGAVLGVALATIVGCGAAATPGGVTVAPAPNQIVGGIGNCPAGQISLGNGCISAASYVAGCAQNGGFLVQMSGAAGGQVCKTIVSKSFVASSALPADSNNISGYNLGVFKAKDTLVIQASGSWCRNSLNNNCNDFTVDGVRTDPNDTTDYTTPNGGLAPGLVARELPYASAVPETVKFVGSSTNPIVIDQDGNLYIGINWDSSKFKGDTVARSSVMYQVTLTRCLDSSGATFQCQ